MHFFDVIAPLYDFFAPGLENTIRHLKEIGNFSHNDIVLDMGGGTGRVAERLRPWVKEIIVADISKKMLRQCERKGLRSVLISGTILPFADAYFDKVVIVDAFHHFQDKRGTMREIKRVLKPGGSIIIEEFNPVRLGGKWIVFVEKILMLGSVFYVPEHLRDFLTNEGFESALYESDTKEYYVVAMKIIEK